MYLYIILLLFVVSIIFIVIYAYNSGSCKIDKKYTCDDKFCLYKIFHYELNELLKNEINKILLNDKIQKRVNITMYPENLFGCALPNKKGITISTESMVKYAPNTINFYQTELCEYMSSLIGLKLYPTNLNLPTTCVLLIYENEGDWINWHYDHNYYNGRFFTVIIPITNEKTCTDFVLMDDQNNIKNISLIGGKSICFEGNFLYHKASKLCKNQKRVLLSCQYVTDNTMNNINEMRLKLKDYAYIGKIF